MVDLEVETETLNTKGYANIKSYVTGSVLELVVDVILNYNHY